MLFDYFLIPEGCDVYRKRGNKNVFKSRQGRDKIKAGLLNVDIVKNFYEGWL
jgi:hypothetical protein